MPPARHPSITLKQAKLSFGATKRTNSINSIKSKAKGSSPALSRTSSTVLDTVTRKRTRSTEVISDSEEELDPDAKLDKTISSDVERSTVATSEPDLYDFESEVEDKVEVPPVKKRRTALPKPRNEPLVKAQPTKLDAEIEKVEAVPVIETTVKDKKVERRKLNVNDKCYRKHYGAVREKMGNLKPVHSQGQTVVHHILRIFDLTYEYGPCIGVTRLERWNRADAMGLNPPPEVREILDTEEGFEKPEFSQTVFYGEV